MQLSDRTIRRMVTSGHISIEPRPGDKAFQPATVDLKLGALDGVHHPVYTQEGAAYMLEPGVFMIGSTYESLGIGRQFSAEVKGKSTLGRLGLGVECAGFIDPGFHGQIVLELKNLHHENAIPLTIGMTICQIKFTQLDEPCDRPYGSPGLGSHYQGQSGPTGARTW